MHTNWRATTSAPSSQSPIGQPLHGVGGEGPGVPSSSRRGGVPQMPAGRSASRSDLRPAGRAQLPIGAPVQRASGSTMGLPAGFPSRIDPGAWTIARRLHPEHAREIHRIVHEDGLAHVLLGDLVPRVSPQPGRPAIRLEGQALEALVALQRTGGLRQGLALLQCEAHQDAELGWMPAVGFLVNMPVLAEAAHLHRDVVADRTGDTRQPAADAIVAMLRAGDAAIDCLIESIVLGYGRSSGERFERHLFAGTAATDSEPMRAYIADQSRRLELAKPDAEVPAPQVPAFIKDDTVETKGLVDNYLVQGDAIQNYLHGACVQSSVRDCRDVDVAVTAAIAQAACWPRPAAR